MTIKAKSNILVLIFSLLLIFNGVGLFISLNKIEEANKRLIEEAKLTFMFQDMKFIIKNLQELSTDLTLMSDKAGLEELNNLESDYRAVFEKIQKLNTHKENNETLSNISNIFDSYLISLKKMADYGIKSVEERNLLFQTFSTIENNLLNEDIKNTYNKFVEAAFNVEAEMEILDGYSETIEKNINNVVKSQEEYLEESVKDDLEIINTFKTVSILLTIALAIGVIALYIIIKNILSNIQNLDYGVQSLIESDHAEKINITTNDELGNISNNFNKFIDKVNNDYEIDKIAIENARSVIGKVNAGLYNDSIKVKAASEEVSLLINEINGMIKRTQKPYNFI